MKVLIVNKFLYPNGGSETYIFRIGDQLKAMGHEVQYFGMEHEGRIVGNHAGSYTADMNFHQGGISRITYPFRILYSKDARRKIRLVLEDFHPDVVHLNNINFQITPSIIDEIKAFDPKIRILYTAHDYQWVCPNHMLKIPATGELCTRCIHGDFSNCRKNRCIHNSTARSILGTMEADLYKKRQTYRLVDTIICPSHFMEKMLSCSRQLAGRTVTLHNFLDVQQEAGRADQNVLKKLPERYVLYFGRYDQEKGIRTLLECAGHLKDIPFVFAGKGSMEAEVSALPGGTNLGFLSGETLREVIRRADFALYPSEWYENCPFSVMEAQLYGTPVLASDLGGTPELVEEGVSGELFQGGNREDLERSIVSLWQDPEKVRKMKSACTLSAEKRFDTLEAYCRKLAVLYRGD